MKNVLLLGVGVLAGVVISRGDTIWHHIAVRLPDGGPPTITIPAQGDAPTQAARFWPATSNMKEPLVVDLHQWSATQAGSNGDDERFDLAVYKAGWNFIRPNLAGKNNTEQACCSMQVLAQIRSAIDYAKAHGPVDDRAVYVVGVSGGGYTALCAYMNATIHARMFVAWAAITDLAAWHAEHKGDLYGRDVEACTGNLAQCAARSPLTMGSGQPDTPVYIFAGINDGFVGSVPIWHSVSLFNKLVETNGHPDQRISYDTLLGMMIDRKGPDTDAGQHLSDRLIHLHKDVGNVHLTVFEGGHEMLTKATMHLMETDYKNLK